MRYKLRATYFPDVDKVYFKLIRSSLDRSEIGKKAYRTFLKNGGKRDSQGRFSKTDSDWTVRVYTCKDLEPKIQVDWENVGEELHATYQSNRGSMHDPKMVKRFAQVFKNYGLLREGVEI